MLQPKPRATDLNLADGSLKIAAYLDPEHRAMLDYLQGRLRIKSRSELLRCLIEQEYQAQREGHDGGSED